MTEEEVPTTGREVYKISGEYGGFTVNYEREVLSHEDITLEQIVAYLVSQGLAPFANAGYGEAIAKGASRQAGCPTHGTEKVGEFDGRKECKVTVQSQPTGGNWRDWTGKDGKRRWTCAEKWD